jgi:MFS family permease
VPRGTRSGLVTLIFSGVAHAYSHLFTLLYATVVLRLEREWGLPYADLFALGIPMTVLFGLGVLPSGWLADRWGSPGMIAIFFFGVGTASVATGMADSPLGLGIGLSFIGLFASIYHPVGIPWLLKNAANRGRALGIIGVAGTAGLAGAGIVAGFLGDKFGWRSAFWIPGTICILTGVLFLAALRVGLIHEAENDVVPHPEPRPTDRQRAFIALVLSVLFTGLVYQTISFALPKIFSDRIGPEHGLAEVGVMVTVVYGLAAVAQIIGGELMDRYRIKWFYVGAQLLQFPALAMAFGLSGPLLVAAMTLAVSFNVISQPVEDILIARHAPLSWRGRAFGIKFVLVFFVSSAGVAMIPVVHVLTGSLDFLFLILGACALGGICAGVAFPDEVRPARASSLIQLPVSPRGRAD